ncbi:acyl-CoA thioester hydrolase/BAAT C-terminal domain-containing protein [Micromonospora endolithica]|uniref:acyl-CoA thioester hydrolase/BAAT C-terminal domain-containing protein n=1 Tax=Micromonospora endolithica TaxID=230091 RepID=UPI0011ABDC9B|nr:acyl-CoA thioester hydrolase/BAAT C-terminal domain-containing protein [Micromonospora endolithica]TWJ24511.1 dienelactone hydrolase [Micromonospora endolithica]
MSTRFQAALLASRGFTALAVGYFGLPGLPPTLHDIPIEYFATAARLLPPPVRVVGYSRGSEAALLVAALHPDLIGGTIVYDPASRVNPGFPGGGDAWTHGGSAQTVIPLASIEDPVLAIAGTDDRLWPSADAALTLWQRIGAEIRLYDGAGHGVGAPPYLTPATGAYLHPRTGEVFDRGGTREADARARAESWPELLAALGA